MDTTLLFLVCTEVILNFVKVPEQDHMYTMSDLMYARHNVENFRGSHFKFVVAKLSVKSVKSYTVQKKSCYMNVLSNAESCNSHRLS